MGSIDGDELFFAFAVRFFSAFLLFVFPLFHANASVSIGIYFFKLFTFALVPLTLRNGAVAICVHGFKAVLFLVVVSTFAVISTFVGATLMKRGT